MIQMGINIKPQNNQNMKYKIFKFLVVFSLVILGVVMTCLTDSSGSVKDMTYSIPTLGEGKYTGEVDDQGLPHDSRGLFKSENKIIEYKGSFVHGKADGKATYKIEDQTFEGTFKNNEYENGKLTMADGSYFEGDFKSGQPYNGAWYKKSGQLESKVVNGK